MEKCVRVNVGTREENERFLAALNDIITNEQTPIRTN
jgi:histidinol-phosphate/aromatic aminotransferase/cobyric acid decarboxylase-like protein